jgi:hypothetical protein
MSCKEKSSTNYSVFIRDKPKLKENALCNLDGPISQRKKQLLNDKRKKLMTSVS